MYNLDCIALRHRLYKEQVIVIYVQNQRVYFRPSAAVRLVMIIEAVLSFTLWILGIKAHDRRCQ